MYVVIGSSTTAQRLKNNLERVAGIPSYVVKTPPRIRTGGCSYSVKADDRALDTVKKIARSSGISYRKIYTVRKDVKGESVYHDIS